MIAFMFVFSWTYFSLLLVNFDVVVKFVSIN